MSYRPHTLGRLLPLLLHCQDQSITGKESTGKTRVFQGENLLSGPQIDDYNSPGWSVIACTDDLSPDAGTQVTGVMLPAITDTGELCLKTPQEKSENTMPYDTHGGGHRGELLLYCPRTEVKFSKMMSGAK